MRVCVPLLLLLASALPASAEEQAADAWAQLRVGMTRREALAVLGRELLGTAGGGFELAIYDSRSEVLFLDGRVIAWTAPAESRSAPPPVATWSFAQDPVVRLGVRVERSAGARRGSPERQGRWILPPYRW